MRCISDTNYSHRCTQRAGLKTAVAQIVNLRSQVNNLRYKRTANDLSVNGFYSGAICRAVRSHALRKG